jgi:hypothetical protein
LNVAQRKALAIAGAISISGMSAALAIGANFGLFGLAAQQSQQVGNFAPAAEMRPVSDSAGAPPPAAAPSTDDPPDIAAPPSLDVPAPVEAPVVSPPPIPTSPSRAAEHRPTTAPARTPAPAPAAGDDHRGSSNSGPGSGTGDHRGRDHPEDSSHGGDDD